ncbi:putative nuclease HARBI1 [Tanacetum coccineum]
MSDSESGDSDVKDFKDLDMIFELARLEQQQQEEAERVRHRNYINRERVEAEAQLMADYFSPRPKYPDYYFRLRVQPDATGVPGFSVILKCTCAIRQLAYGVTPDSLDEYLQMGSHTARDSLIVCTGNREIAQCLWHGQFGRGDKKYPTILLEAVASYDLWIWHAFFGVAGANNDLIVLNNSSLFDNLLDGIDHVAPFECNEVTFEKGYYLADGIYPQWASFVKSFTVASSEKNVLYKRKQEGARKDIERAFGVLQGRWRIISQSARA